MKTISFSLIALLLLSAPANAQTHGPHGGAVGNAGATAIEVVPDAQNAFSVYILDEQWNEIPVKAYTLSGTIAPIKKTTVTCTHKEKRFHCIFPPVADLSGKKGSELVLQLVKGGKEPVGEARIQLPLQTADLS